jgi:acetylornithine deacetylase/succinyl-diaminopimelate desuccinylase-like protein
MSRLAPGVLVGSAALGVALVACGCTQQKLPKVDGERAYARVVRQVEFGPRIPGSPGHAAMQTWLIAELKRLGGQVEEQRFTDTTLGRPLELVNVIARWNSGDEPSLRNIMLCAHYDTRAMATQDPDTTRRHEPVPGANDGGSGVAVLLEIAELLSRKLPPVAVTLVFFDGEDQGEQSSGAEFCLGSRAYAARLGAQRPTAAFLFDMVGDRNLDIYPEVTSSERASNLVGLVLDGARATGARGFHDEPRHQVFDDHIPLLEAGLPAVDIIDFEYPAWHTTHDLPDQVSAASLAQVAGVAAWIVYQSPLARPIP